MNPDRLWMCHFLETIPRCEVLRLWKGSKNFGSDQNLNLRSAKILIMRKLGWLHNPVTGRHNLAESCFWKNNKCIIYLLEGIRIFKINRSSPSKYPSWWIMHTLNWLTSPGSVALPLSESKESRGLYAERAKNSCLSKTQLRFRSPATSWTSVAADWKL